METRIINALIAFIAAAKPTKWSQDIHVRFALAVLAKLDNDKDRIEAAKTFGLVGNASQFAQAMRKRNADPESSAFGKLTCFKTEAEEVSDLLVKLDF